jgi:hypothetical protein
MIKAAGANQRRQADGVCHAVELGDALFRRADMIGVMLVASCLASPCDIDRETSAGQAGLGDRL